VLAGLFAVPLASAATRPPVQSTHVKQAVHALVVRGQPLDRIYQLRSRPDDRAGLRGIGSTHTAHRITILPDNRTRTLGIGVRHV
jgi:hypothetical protein